MHQSRDQPGYSISCTIVRWAELDPPPGIVAVEVVDVRGGAHSYLVKFYDVSEAELDEKSSYPRPGFIVCRLVQTETDADGNLFAFVDIDAMPLKGTDNSIKVPMDRLLPVRPWQSWQMGRLK